MTRNIGCVNGQTIQEFAGDLIFLAPDGLRTVAGTARIGDVELGTISTNVQSIFNDNIANALVSITCYTKQNTVQNVLYKVNTVQSATEGVAHVLRGQTFEFCTAKRNTTYIY